MSHPSSLPSLPSRGPAPSFTGVETQWSPVAGGEWEARRSADTPRGAERLRREAALLAQLPRGRFAQVVETHDSGSGFRLRCRVAQPWRLDEWLQTHPPLSPRRALRLALESTRCVAALHAVGQPDKHLVPARFFVAEDAPADVVCLAEIGPPTRAAVEERVPGPIAWIEGDLSYIAPEQTGRLNRTVDHRADLYTLGVILYELLTGRRAFSAADDLGLVHAQLSLMPLPPSRLDPAIPDCCDRLIARLVAKSPDDRYQSADGLAADLELLLALDDAALAALDFAPGRADRPEALQIPGRLYGRESEVRQLLGAFGATAAGARTLVLVAGYSGVGKSSVINEVQRPITAARGTFIAAKFDQYQRDMPYGGMLSALGQLLELVLAERQPVIERWRLQLRDALAGEGGVLLDLLPELVRLIGAQPALPDVGPNETTARLKRAFRRFIGVFATAGHPLVLFLDDLQWADAASLQLLETLYGSDPATGHLMVIGAYRDNEITPGHLLTATLQRIRDQGTEPLTLTLAPLDEAAVCELLADTLRRPQDDVSALAATLRAKTEGNPFYVKVLLRSLERRGSIRRAPDLASWTIDAGALADEGVSGNVVELLLDAMRDLPPRAARTLSLAAFLGASFAIDALVDLAGGDAAAVLDDLDLLQRRRYLVHLHDPLHDPRRSVARFQHDRIQEAAYRLCPEAERAARHVEIGRQLAAGQADLVASPELFTILRHLNHGIASAAGAGRLELLRLNLAAARRARRSLAYETGANLLAAAQALVDEAAWAGDHALAFDAGLEYGRLLLLTARAVDAERFTDSLRARAEGPLELARLNLLRIEFYTLDARFQACVDAAAEALAGLGFELPRDDLELHHRELKTTLDGLIEQTPLDRLPTLPPITDPKVILALNILNSVVAAAFFLDTRLLRVVTALGVVLSIRYGRHPATAYLLSSQGVAMGLDFDRQVEALAYGDAGVRLAELEGDNANLCQATHNVLAYLNHWVRPLANVSGLIRRSLEAGVLAGEARWIGYGHVMHAYLLFFQGMPLPQLIEIIDGYSADQREQASRRMVKGAMNSVRRLVGRLRGDDAVGGKPLDLSPAAETLQVTSLLERGSLMPAASHSVGLAQAYALLGDWPEALALVTGKRMRGLNRRFPGMFGVAVQAFLDALLLARFQARDDPEVRRQVEACGRQLERWALQSPVNFSHYPLAVRAELAAVDGDPGGAAALMRRAAAAAHAGAMRFDHLLLVERAGELCIQAGDVAGGCDQLAEAARAARDLGITEKSVRLERRYPFLASPERRAPAPGCRCRRSNSSACST